MQALTRRCLPLSGDSVVGAGKNYPDYMELPVFGNLVNLPSASGPRALATAAGRNAAKLRRVVDGRLQPQPEASVLRIVRR